MPSFLPGIWASYSGPHACKPNPHWLSSQFSNVIFSYTQTFVWNDWLKFMDSSISSRKDWDGVQRRVKTGLLQFIWVDSVHPLLALSSVISPGQAVSTCLQEEHLHHEVDKCYETGFSFPPPSFSWYPFSFLSSLFFSPLYLLFLSKNFSFF